MRNDRSSLDRSIQNDIIIAKKKGQVLTSYRAKKQLILIINVCLVIGVIDRSD
jgi:hypothetical protein